MAAKKLKKTIASALPITDAEGNAAIVRGMITGMPPEFDGMEKHAREILRRIAVIERRDSNGGRFVLIRNDMEGILESIITMRGEFAAEATPSEPSLF